MRILSLGRVLVVVLLVLLVAGPAAAQDKQIVVAGGWAPQWVSVAGDSTTLPLGLMFNVAGTVLPNVQVVGDIGYGRKSGDSWLTATGGVRYVIPMKDATKASPFVEGLVGLGNLSGGGDSISAFTFGVGGGVDVKATAQINVRLQLNYFYARKYGANVQEIRFGLGLSTARKF